MSTRVAAALLTTTTVFLGTAATASAETSTLKDRASDVLSFADQTTDERGTQLSYSQSIASGVDLRSLRVKHTTRSVALRAKFSRLDQATTLYVYLRFDGSSKPTRFFVNTKENTGVVLNTQGTKRCTVPVTHIYGTGGTINAVIKRSCLGTPKRVKATAFAADQGFFGDNTAYTIDPLSPVAVRGQSYTRWLTAS